MSYYSRQEIMKSYTTVELAKRLGIGRDTLYRWLRAEKIKGSKVTRLGPFKVRLWTERDVRKVEQFMKEYYIEGRGRKKAAKQ